MKEYLINESLYLYLRRKHCQNEVLSIWGNVYGILTLLHWKPPLIKAITHFLSPSWCITGSINSISGSFHPLIVINFTIAWVKSVSAAEKVTVVGREGNSWYALTPGSSKLWSYVILQRFFFFFPAALLSHTIEILHALQDMKHPLQIIYWWRKNPFEISMDAHISVSSAHIFDFCLGLIHMRALSWLLRLCSHATFVASVNTQTHTVTADMNIVPLPPHLLPFGESLADHCWDSVTHVTVGVNRA